MKKGLIHVYTGEGKGKTTASVGLAVRAKSHGLKVLFVSFNKEPKKWGCGEYKIFKKIGIDTLCFAQKHPRFYKNTSLKTLKIECRAALECLNKTIKKKKYDLLILDEINVALNCGYLKEEEILSFLKTKPENLEIILTGRGATKKIIEKADLVSEIKKIKHPYDKGIIARKGIEF
ncbi:MAG: cob(I)yrinic acid a,c-diamide adenosyltransferase [Elusimicrobia bacterium]|nr:cob(I)yrinic acid a,c-diamide adenosyltransferase [Elusimicrobiota bacterium]MBU2615186.1 cob(I)yrinic acid a,c-diamide adenosyltransferase [Elusimicrobiota bacterium]